MGYPVSIAELQKINIFFRNTGYVDTLAIKWLQ